MSEFPGSVDGSPHAGAVLDAVRAQRDDLLEFIGRLARCESPSSDPVAQGPVFDVLEEALGEVGFKTMRFAGVSSGGQLLAAPQGRDFGGIELDVDRPVVDAGARPPLQLLLGHCDTVWAHGTLDDMPVQIDGSVMRGPGVFDMKAGLAQAIFALRALRHLDLEPTVVPLMFVNSDEEIGSHESAPRIVHLARHAQRVFVMEPALGVHGKLKTARKGVGQFVVTAKGKAAHAGLDPEAGASAILEMSHQVQRLDALNDPARQVSINVGIIGGGTRANVIAPECHAVVDVRVPDADQAERITAAIYNLVAVTQGVSLEISGAVERTPLERNARNQALWHLARGLAGDLGLQIDEGFAGGGSDGNLTSPVAATLDGLGAVGDGAHALHEHIDVERSLERCALLAMLLLSEGADA